MAAPTRVNQPMQLWIVLLLALVWPSFAQAQGTVMPNARITYLTNTGDPLVNGKICTYQAGSVNTAQATYSDEALTVELPNPIRTNAAGRPQNASGTETNVYWGQQAYKVVVLTAGSDNTCDTGTTIFSADHVPAIPAIAAATDIEGTAGQALTAGQAVYLSTSDGKWYLADADATATSTTAGMVGVVPSNIASGATGSIRLQGRITGLSALSVGAKYYISATAGAITATPPTNARFIAQADSTTSIVVGGNPGSVVLPDSDGTHSFVIRASGNLSADGLVTVAGTANITIGNDTKPCQGRLSLTSGTAVTVADVTAAGTIYYVPYDGNQCAVYDGTSTWVTLTFTELSVAATCTASNMYDVFIYNNSGTLALETLIWTNATTRATAITQQNGVDVKTGATTRRLLGSFYCTATNQTEDSFARRMLSNRYFCKWRPMRVQEATNSWTYTTAAYQQANAAATNQLDLVQTVRENKIHLWVIAYSKNTMDNIVRAVSIGEDGTTPPTGVGGMFVTVDVLANTFAEVNAEFIGFPSSVGRHYYPWLEYSAATGTTTWYGDNNTPTILQSGIYGEVCN